MVLPVRQPGRQKAPTSPDCPCSRSRFSRANARILRAAQETRVPMKVWTLKLHRWIALLFSLPLVIVLGTGLVLSVEPWRVGRAIKPGTLTADQVRILLDKHDPQGRAGAISYRAYDNTLTIGRAGSGATVDVATGATQAAPSWLAATLGTMRRT